MLLTTKGKRGTGREAQAGFFFAPSCSTFSFSFFLEGGEGRKALSRWSVHGRQPPLLSPFFPSFLLHLLSSLYYGLTVTHQQASLLGVYCFAPADRILPAYLTPFLLFPLPPPLYQQLFVSRTPFSPDVSEKQGGGEGKR